MREPSFDIYANVLSRDMPLSELIALNESGDLLARAENSGCESCYVEVARWSDDKGWRRYAFSKCLDYRLDGMEDASDEATAEEIAKRINDAAWHKGKVSFIHNLQAYGD